MHTREQRINGKVSHSEYYEQFVTKQVLELVLSRIGKERIENSIDEHLNDIPLKLWDRLHPSIMVLTYQLRLEAGEGNSLATGVCIAKAAAHKHLTTTNQRS